MMEKSLKGRKGPSAKAEKREVRIVGKGWWGKEKKFRPVMKRERGKRSSH